MATPQSRLNQLPGIGPSLASRLGILGLETIEDLIYYFPRAWEDLSKLTPISELLPPAAAPAPDGPRRTIQATLSGLKTFRSPIRRMVLTQGLASDASGSIPVIWFNQPYLRTTLKAGTEYFLTGKVIQRSGKPTLVSPDLERASDIPVHHLRIVPIYPESGGLTTKIFRRLTAHLAPLIRQLPEYLPDFVRKQYDLLPLPEALLHLHFPASLEYLQKAKDRLSFDELLFTQLAIQQVKQLLHSAVAKPIPQDIEYIKTVLTKLPYQLTASQKKALWEIVQDLSAEKPANRLLEGDVGSGKTIVAAIAMMTAARAGFRSVLMAPTEVLAYQHYYSLQPLLAQFGISCRLHTQSYQLGPTAAQVTVGTHALIQESVTFTDLNLVIIDEQHRFGVEQREKLKHKGLMPHFISLTATPIPRSLALTLFGDLDLSVITEKPVGRKPIVTKVISQRSLVYKLIQQEVNSGHQAFIITPLISDSDRMSVKSAEKEFKNIQNIFPHARVGLLHGRLTTDKKQAVMEALKGKKLDILVATSVIEVGVDIPNATVMLIEGAEKFGLAQLHQLRGRVGRAQYQSYCFVAPSVPDEGVLQRLQIFAANTDGFKLAEMDLQMRGPGSLFGKTQSGFIRYRLADWTDAKAIKVAQDAALELLADSPDLSKYPLLKKKVNMEGITVHSE